MARIWHLLRQLAQDQEGASAVEYGVILALIIAAVIVIIATLGSQVEQGFNNFYAAFEAAKAGP